MEDELKALFKITSALKEKYNRSFPLDGRLVGDIGEALVQNEFHVNLYPENNECYDAYEIGSNRQIQIKASMKYNFSYPFKHNPDFFMAVHIKETARIEVVYNGKGKLIKDYIIQNNLKAYNQTWYPISAGVLKMLNSKVDEIDRIKKKVALQKPHTILE